MLSSLSFHYSLLSIGSVSAGDEPFICGGRAFICESSGTVPAGGTDAGTEEDNSGKKQVRVHKHADYLGTCTEIYCTQQHPHAWRTYCVSASRHETSCLFRGVEKNAHKFKNRHMQMSSPREPLGHGRSTVSPLCVVGHWTPRTSLDSQTWGSGP